MFCLYCSFITIKGALLKKTSSQRKVKEDEVCCKMTFKMVEGSEVTMGLAIINKYYYIYIL